MTLEKVHLILKKGYEIFFLIVSVENEKALGVNIYTKLNVNYWDIDLQYMFY